MKFLICLLFLIFDSALKVTSATGWSPLVNTVQYRDMKLVTESESPFKPQYFPIAGHTALSASMACGKFCASNASCWAFNFYNTATHYICEFTVENFCTNPQKVVLQTWPGSKIWDKLTPPMTRACIDQLFEETNETKFCDIVSPGCTGRWPDCNNCIQTCANCSGTDIRNCTLWPEGPGKRPIFGVCDSKATVIIERRVQLSNGTVGPNYIMSFIDMGRLSTLSVYNALTFQFSSSSDSFHATYLNFTIDPEGGLRDMKFKSGVSDGFNLKGTVMKYAPFIYVQPNNNCGSFWLLNATRTGANLTCPGGGIGMFGVVDISAFPKKTGIQWPQTGVLNYIKAKMDIIP